MGYYTKVKCDLILKKETPKQVIDFLHKTIVERDLGMGNRIMWSVGEEPRPDINHPFADCPRWSSLFCSEIYRCNKNTEFQANEDDGTYTLIVRGNLKDYNEEIGLFSDWIKPFIDVEKTACPVVLWKGEDDDIWTGINLL